MERTRHRARARLIDAGSGPQSTSMALAPSRTMIASPCPTSRTTTSAGHGIGADSVTATSVASTSAPMRTRITRRGAGHQHHTPTQAAAHIATAATVGVSIGSEDPGRPASHPTEAITGVTITADAARTTEPADGATARSSAPIIATRTGTWTRGAVQAARGATGETHANAAHDTGHSPACAPIAEPIGPLNHSARRGSAAEHHSRASGPRSTSPQTAATPTINPRSNAAGGSRPTRHPTAILNDAVGSRRRPANDPAAATAAAIPARTSDTRHPDTATKSSAVAHASTARAPGRAPHRRANHIAIATASARCRPDPPIRYETPAALNASWVSDPSSCRRSPNRHDAITAEPGVSRARNAPRQPARHRSSEPVNPGVHPGVSTRHARPAAHSPARNASRAPVEPVSPGLRRVQTCTCSPYSGTRSLFGHATETTGPPTVSSRTDTLAVSNTVRGSSATAPAHSRGPAADSASPVRASQAPCARAPARPTDTAPSTSATTRRCRAQAARHTDPTTASTPPSSHAPPLRARHASSPPRAEPAHSASPHHSAGEMGGLATCARATAIPSSRGL
jgi:hypothetical protein